MIEKITKDSFKYHEINPSYTMYNLNAVELFEIVDEYEEAYKNKVVSMMSKKSRKEYLEIYNKN